MRAYTIKALYAIMLAGLMVLIVLIVARWNHHGASSIPQEHTIAYEGALYGRVSFDDPSLDHLNPENIRGDDLEYLFTLDDQTAPGGHPYSGCPVYRYKPMRSTALLIVNCDREYEPYVFANFFEQDKSGRDLLDVFGIDDGGQVESAGIYAGPGLKEVKKFAGREDIDSLLDFIARGANAKDEFLAAKTAEKNGEQIHYLVFRLSGGMRMRFEIRDEEGYLVGYGLYLKISDEHMPLFDR